METTTNTNTAEAITSDENDGLRFDVTLTVADAFGTLPLDVPVLCTVSDVASNVRHFLNEGDIAEAATYLNITEEAFTSDFIHWVDPVFDPTDIYNYIDV